MNFHYAYNIAQEIVQDFCEIDTATPREFFGNEAARLAGAPLQYYFENSEYFHGLSAEKRAIVASLIYPALLEYIGE